MHDFKLFPELPNSLMNEEYFNSPHKQITENFMATVVKVHDGDTVTLQWDERDFNFPLRINGIDSPELNVRGGHEARDYLKTFIEGALVEIIINPKERVEKWGRLLGDIVFGGFTISENMIDMGHAVPFEDRHQTEFMNIDKEWNTKKWFKDQ